jgi:metallo-beta-lactamase class B
MSMRMLRYFVVLLIAAPVVLPAQTSPLTAEQRAQFHGPYSQPEEPFRLIGNIYYVGAKNIASYLVTTPQGNILIDTGTTEMTPVITANIEKLGFKVRDIKIMLSSHAHFDHIGGHAAMKKLTGARVMAIRQDAEALEAGKDLSPLGDEGWTPVKVDRVLKDGDTVTLGGATLRAVWAPGHTPGCTVWTTSVPDGGRSYSVAIFGCGGPNGGVKLVGNQRFPTLVDDTMATFRKLKRLRPDIYVSGHPQMLFAGKIDRMKAAERPHPLLDPQSQAWVKMLDEAEANFTKRVQAEHAQSASR